jgi:hypothetical protein
MIGFVSGNGVQGVCKVLFAIVQVVGLRWIATWHWLRGRVEIRMRKDVLIVTWGTDSIKAFRRFVGEGVVEII